MKTHGYFMQDDAAALIANISMNVLDKLLVNK
jgi:hypothetical protein